MAVDAREFSGRLYPSESRRNERGFSIPREWITFVLESAGRDDVIRDLCLQDNQTSSDSDCNGFRAARDIQLIKDGCDVELDGMLRNSELPGDFLVA